MKFNISPGILIFILGFTGIVFALVDESGQIGSKIPLAIFFIVLMIIGMAIQMAPKDWVDGIFGEVEGERGFG